MKAIINVYLSNRKRNTILFFLCLYCFILLLFRAKISHSTFYFFLIWNLFLAALPYLIIVFAKENIRLLENLKIRIIVFLSWLLFLPNSFYIITDFVHLKKGNPELFWFDLILLFSYTSLGFLFGLLSIKEFNNCFSLFYRFKTITILLPIICLLIGFGIYLGRFKRFNSWNIITNPFQLLLNSIETFFTSEAILFSLFYGSFIYIIYILKNQFYK